MFSLLFGVVLSPLGYGHPDRLVRIWQTSQDWETQKSDRVPVSYPNFLDWRERNHVFEGLATYFPKRFVLAADESRMEVSGASVSDNLFELLQVVPTKGRGFSRDDFDARSNVAVISWRLSRTLFSEADEAIGKSIRAEGQSFVVVGVLPEDFRWWFPQTSGEALKWASIDLWIPLFPPTRLFRQNSFLQVVGRLKKGVDLEQARVEMNSIAKELKLAYPGTTGGVSLQSLHASVTEPYRTSFELLMTAAILILATAIFNLAGLFIGRGLERRREVAVRMAIGASYRQLAKQFLVESLVVSGLAVVIGTILANWSLTALKALLPVDIPRIDQVGANSAAAIAFTAAAAGVAAFLLTLGPLIRIRSDRGARQLTQDLRRYAPHYRSRLLTALVAGEIGCTLCLLAASGLALDSFVHLKSVDLGVDATNLFYTKWILPESKYGTPSERAQLVSAGLAAIKAELGNDLISACQAAPFANWNSSTVIAEGASEENPPTARVNAVSSGYFQTLGVRLLEGRDFGDLDNPTSSPVSIVNQTAAESLFPGLDAAGRKLKVYSTWTRVVGTVANARQASLDDKIPAEVYLPISQSGPIRLTVLARLGPQTQSSRSELVHRLRAIEPEAVLGTPAPFQDSLSNILSGPRIRFTVFSLLAAMAAMVSFVGVFGVVSNAVNGRRHEFGIRIALGATGSDLHREIVLRNLGTIAVGIATGLVLFAMVGKLLSTQLFALTGANRPVLVVTIGLVLAVALFATYLPSRRVRRIDPVSVLRSE